MNEVLKTILILFGSAIIFIPLGMLMYKLILKAKKKNAENEAKNILDRAKLEAETAYKNEIIKSKEEALHIKNLADEEVKERRKEVSIKERRIIQKEEQIDKKEERQERKERELYNFENRLTNKEKELERLEEEKKEELLKVSQLTVDEAKEIIICNFDLNPGYAGVENPLYERTEGVYMKLGDAKETLRDLLKELILIQNSGNVQ